MQHVGRSLRGTTDFAPFPDEARRIETSGEGELAFACGPNLSHLVLTLQGLRWIEALLDPYHGVAPDIILGDKQFECREGARRPVAFRNLICFRAFLRADDLCVYPNRLSSIGSPNTHVFERRALELRAVEPSALELRAE